jgi:hypothetical protein
MAHGVHRHGAGSFHGSLTTTTRSYAKEADAQPALAELRAQRLRESRAQGPVVLDRAPPTISDSGLLVGAFPYFLATPEQPRRQGSICGERAWFDEADAKRKRSVRFEDLGR